MFVDKIIVHPIKNGPDVFELPATMVLSFLDSEKSQVYELEAPGSGGEFIVSKPFVYNDCEGKMYALDRTKESGSYFKLYNSGIEKTDVSVLNIHTRISGPFASFALCVK
ncbi:Hypothetical protein HVR_LOCUS560 [uncultured virus]|nr:Hypothetical protein HVR_LOCUS560 [uncultured virus]